MRAGRWCVAAAAVAFAGATQGRAVEPAAQADGYPLKTVSIVVPADADPMLRLAADELRQFAYRRTGVLPPVVNSAPATGPAIVLRTGPSEHVPTGGPGPLQNHALYVESGTPACQVVHGASPTATLWAAYSLIESWGFGFYLGETTEPVRDAEFPAPLANRTFVPALAVRGNLPWFNFLNSPTTWNPQDYRFFFQQMARQKANFIGFHAYDHEPFGGYDITSRGATKGGPLMTTISPHRWWSPPAMSTKDFLFGTDQLFDRGEWGCEVGIEDAWTWAPGRAVRLQQQMMAEALGFAKQYGIRTCLGWEVTGNPDDPAVRDDLRRRLEHTLATYPLDYFWIWQSEFGGVGGKETGTAVDEDIRAAFAYLGPDHNLSEAARITKFIRLTHEMLGECAPQVRLIVSGWGGDQWMKFTTLYPGLDQVVPEDVIFAALDNIDPAIAPAVSEAYGRLKPGRQRWPIPWFESDGGFTRCDQTGPQPNVCVFEPLLKDIVRKGCQGALGIHWRTRNVQDVAGYLYRFGWNAELTPQQFFLQYAADHYGPADAEEMAKVHLRLEELGPQYVGAAGCVECFTSFTWFYNPEGGKSIFPDAPHIGHRPYCAGHLPDESRFEELETLASRLVEKVKPAMDAKHDTAAFAYHDLASTIRWLVGRAKVGSAIWNDSAPLARKLRQAERLLERGQVEEARALAGEVYGMDWKGAGLRNLDFGAAFRDLASTCRTRGELGMLATANARYGRYYASFLDRIARVLGFQHLDSEWTWHGPLPRASGSDVPIQGPRVFLVLPVPDHVAPGESCIFDVTLIFPRSPRMNMDEYPSLSLENLVGANETPIRGLRMVHDRGSGCWRWMFRPEHEGVWAWHVSPPYGDHVSYSNAARFNLGNRGVITVGSAAPAPRPAYVRPEAVGQKEPVLRIGSDEGLPPGGELVGNAVLAEGPKGQCLDTRNGGYVRVPDSAGRALAFAGPFSLAFRVNPEPWDAAKEMPVLLSKGDWFGPGYLVQLYRGRLRISLGRQRAFDAPVGLEPGRWTHVAVVHDGRWLTMFLDGSEVASWDAPLPEPSDLPLRIGAYREAENSEHFPFRGRIDDVVLYNRALTEDEIRALTGTGE